MKTTEQPEIKIERDVPMPPGRRGSGAGYSDTIKKMKVGESFILQSGVSNSNMHTYARYAGAKVCTRKQSDGTFRVWRTE